MSSARRFTIRGRVQGVFFRDSTRRVANSLDITGHAINLSSGDVEVLACGEPEALEKLADWLKDGPRMASVTEIDMEIVSWEELDGFRTA